MIKTSNQPLVSIIIPVYNGSNYLKEAIDSALAQTYKNIEIIVINDGSNDGGATEKIAKSYGNKIRYYSKKNGGVATALNLGISKMKGEYFSWLSHDDVYKSNKVYEQIRILSNLSDKNTIIYSSCELIDENGHASGSTNQSDKYELKYLDYGYFALFKGLMNGCTMLINKNIFDKVGVFDPKYPTTQDYHLWYDMFKIYPVKFVNKDLVKSRIHDQQGSVADSNHVKEADELWLRMIKEITVDDVSGFAVNIYVFYKNVAKHLEASPLRKTYKYVQGLVDERARLVSVILPTYNRDYCIRAAMESVYSQTYQNFELIVVDDGSTDDTEKVISKYSNKKTIYIRQDNTGVSSARNKGIRAANGNYIAFLDSDDYWTPDHLYMHVKALSENTECLMSFNNYRMEGPGSVEGGRDFHAITYPDILFISNSIITTPSVVVRSEVLDEVGLFDEDMKICEDLDLWRRVARKGHIKEIDQILTIVTLRENHFSPDKYLGGRYDFLRKAFFDDENIEKVTIARLLVELWMNYFEGGANVRALYQNIEQAFSDFDFLHIYLRDKLGSGEFGYYIKDDKLPIIMKEKKNHRALRIKNKVNKFQALKSSHGLRVATGISAKKLLGIVINKVRNV